MKNLDWFAARNLAYAGSAIRRQAWHRWITHGRALWFTSATADDGTAIYHVVTADDFTVDEFMATDWTDESWDAAIVPPKGVFKPPKVPPPWAAQPTSSSSSGTGTAGTGTGTAGTGTGNAGTGASSSSGNGGASYWGTSFGDAGNPPDPSSVMKLAGGGGVGPSGDSPRRVPVPNAPPSGNPVTVTVQIQTPSEARFKAACVGFTARTFDEARGFVDTDHSGPMTLAALDFRVTIAGGPAGLGSLHMQLGSTVLPAINIGPGGTWGDTFHSVPFVPGGTVTITATYTINGSSYTGSGSYTFPNWSTWALPTKILLGTTGGSTPVDGFGMAFSAGPNGSTPGDASGCDVIMMF